MNYQELWAMARGAGAAGDEGRLYYVILLCLMRWRVEPSSELEAALMYVEGAAQGIGGKAGKDLAKAASDALDAFSQDEVTVRH